MATVQDTIELVTGDRMTQEEFHRVYEQTPPDFHAELIGGIVYVASPLRIDHGINHPPLTTLLFFYEGHTPGVQTADNATVLLGDEGEPQPDLMLRILPEYAGQSRNSADGYVKGAPELVAEIALSGRAIDLHAKKAGYARYGVLEYLVLSLREPKLFWFDLSHDEERFADGDGIMRLRTFPGLWIHAEALLARDCQRMLAVLQSGLASPDHAEFVRELQGRRVVK